MYYKGILFIVFLILALMITSCANNYRVNTISGRPEVIINGASSKDVSNTIVNFMLNNGFYLQERNEYQIIFGKKATDFGMMLLAGSRYDSVPEWRYIFNMVDVTGGTRVLTNIWVVTNPGSAFERVRELSTNSQAALDMQRVLINLKSSLEKPENLDLKGMVGIRLQGNIIVDVISQTPADIAGLKQGDVILKIDGTPPSNDTNDNIARISGVSGTEAKLTILRNEEEIEFQIMRR